MPAHQNRGKPSVQGRVSTIPSSWEVTTLEKVCVGPPQNGAFIQGARFGSGTLYVNVYDIYQNAVLIPGHVQRVKWDDAAKERYLLKNGDLLFVRSSLKREGVGHCCLVTNLKEPAIFDCHLIRVSPDTSTVEPLYLTYFCLAATQRRDLIARSKTTTMTTLNQNMVMQTPIVLPPMPQQQAIARALALVQNAKEKRERELDLEREHRTALMEYLFTHGTRGEPTKQTEFGEIAESWRVLRLEDVAMIERGKFSHRPRNAPEFYGGNIPFIQTGDVANSNGHIRTYNQTLNERGLSISRIFPKGTIVITIAANIGFTGILDFDSAFPDSLIGITPNEAILPEFLNYYLVTQQPEMDRKAPRGTQKNINIEFLKPWPVVVPPLEEQATIAEVLLACDVKLEGLHRETSLLEELFLAMSEELMNGRLSAVPLIEEHQQQ
jgi:type I restriction enzyme, S subunit